MTQRSSLARSTILGLPGFCIHSHCETIIARMLSAKRAIGGCQGWCPIIFGTFQPWGGLPGPRPTPTPAFLHRAGGWFHGDGGSAPQLMQNACRQGRRKRLPHNLYKRDLGSYAFFRTSPFRSTAFVEAGANGTQKSAATSLHSSTMRIPYSHRPRSPGPELLVPKVNLHPPCFAIWMKDALGSLYRLLISIATPFLAAASITFCRRASVHNVS